MCYALLMYSGIKYLHNDILLGGGSAMALGAKESGLNKWFGIVLERSETLKECPDSVILLLVLFMIAMLTTVASNTACAAIVTPVLLGMVSQI